METYLKVIDVYTGLWEFSRILDIYEGNAQGVLFEEWLRMKESLEIRIKELL